jgi:hypothetical protein
MKRYFEFVQADFEPVKSFHLKDESNLWLDVKNELNIKVNIL